MHDFNIHDLNSAHRHMEEGYVWHNDPVRSRYYNTPIESHAREVGFWRKWFKTYGKVVNHLIDEDVTMTLTPSIAPTKTGEWWHKATDDKCDCLECLIGDETINFKNDVRISTATTEVTIHNKKYTLKNATLIKIFADNIKDTKNGVWTADYTDVIKDIWAEIDNINKEIKNIKNEIAEIQKAIKKIQGDIIDINKKIENINNNIGKFKGGTVTVLKSLWSGKVTDGHNIDLSKTPLTNGNYQIFIESPSAGSFSIRMPWNSGINTNYGQTSFLLPLGGGANGDFGNVRINISNSATSPKVQFSEVRYSKSSGTTTAKNGNTDWYILIMKKEEAVSIG